MVEIKVEFKLYEEFNKLVEKIEIKWITVDGK